LIEPGLFAALFGHDKMADVDWIEGAAENSDALRAAGC
jgi:hypothetical protein